MKYLLNRIYNKISADIFLLVLRREHATRFPASAYFMVSQFAREERKDEQIQ